MPHSSFKLLPGVDQNKTPALNEAAISESQLIRFVPDRTLGGLVQKLGGWSKFYSGGLQSIVRCLWAWEDTNANSYLGIGAEGIAPVAVTNATGNGTTVTLTFSGITNFVVGNAITVAGVNPSGYNGTYVVTATTSTTVSYASTQAGAYVSGGTITGNGSSLEVITSGGLSDITPQKTVVNAAVNFTTDKDSPTPYEVIVTDPGRNADNYDVVDIRTQVSVGGLILFGQYQCYALGTNTYKIYARNVLGELEAATSTVNNGGSVAQFTTTAGSDFVNVTLENHGLLAGDTFPVLIATSVGGVTIYGNYIVNEVTSSDVFIISASTLASSSASAYVNSNKVNFVYYNGIGPLGAGSGYGIGAYGEGAYGAGTAPATGAGVPINAEDWTLDNWGEIFVANPLNGPIYTWSPTTGDPVALIIAEAPPVNSGMFVAMPQRQIVAWGSTFTGIQDPLLIRWCEVNNYNVWIAQITNQAGSYRIPKGSRIIQCIQGPQQGLIWTDLGVWAMQYSGPPYVYQFNELGNGCGLIGRKAAGSMGGVVYWMGPSQFFRLASGGVEPIRCPVWDVVFQDLDTDNVDKIRFAANSRFGEISWFYPTKSNGGEVSHYVKYNVILDQWDYGELGRTAWINEFVLGPPIGAAPDTFIYQHETSPNADGQPMVSYFKSGFLTLSDANVKMFVDQIWPDMRWGYYGGSQSANVNITFFTADYPSETPRVYGPYTMSEASTFITPRFRARLLAVKIESDDPNSFWRLGNIRYRYQEDGKF